MSRWLIIAHRSQESVLGAARSPLRYADNEPKYWKSREEANAECERLNAQTTSRNVWYTIEEVKDDPA